MQEDYELLAACYQQPGPANTESTLRMARRRADQLGLTHALVASTSGATGVCAAEVFRGLHLVVVTHSTGLRAPNQQELLPENRRRITELGAQILTCQHAFGGVNRAVRRKLGTYELDEIIAFTLRNFCEGIKVACEITLMATDAGMVPAGEELVAIAGTGRGADTAAVIRAANSQDFFDLRVLEIVCKPRLSGRE